MTTCYKTKFGQALMNLYQNAPEKADISLTIDFAKGAVLAGDEVVCKRAAAASPLVSGGSEIDSGDLDKISSKIMSDYSRKKKKQETPQPVAAPAKSKSGDKATADNDGQLDWDAPLAGLVLPNKDYPTFHEIELEARRIMAAAKKKNISVEEEVEYRNSQLNKGDAPAARPGGGSLRKREILITPVRSPTKSDVEPYDSQSSLYEMYYPMENEPMEGGGGGGGAGGEGGRTRPTRSNAAKKKRRQSANDSISEDVKLCNSQGETATSFDIDSISLRTDDVFR